MTAPVRIDAAAWGDLRFATLARLCGFADAEHALIKCAKIWAWQTEHYTDELPTYVVDPDIVESALGPGGAGHMVRARLADSGPDGLRIRGSEGRIEWLSKKRRASKCGGEATRRKHADQTGPVGLPVAQPQPVPQTGPTLGALTLPLTLKDPDIHSRARSRHPDAGRVGHAVWLHAEACAIELRNENVSLPRWPSQHGSDHAGWNALLDRVCELLVGSDAEHAERVCMNRVDVAVAMAIKTGEGGFFTPIGMFKRESFEHWSVQEPTQIKRKPATSGNRGGFAAAVMRMAQEEP